MTLNMYTLNSPKCGYNYIYKLLDLKVALYSKSDIFMAAVFSISFASTKLNIHVHTADHNDV